MTGRKKYSLKILYCLYQNPEQKSCQFRSLKSEKVFLILNSKIITHISKESVASLQNLWLIFITELRYSNMCECLEE